MVGRVEGLQSGNKDCGIKKGMRIARSRRGAYCENNTAGVKLCPRRRVSGMVSYQWIY